jgi:hypothetical protein
VGTEAVEGTEDWRGDRGP